MSSHILLCVFFQAEGGIRGLVRSRGLGDVYKRQGQPRLVGRRDAPAQLLLPRRERPGPQRADGREFGCLLYTSDAADERSSVDLGGRRIIKKKNRTDLTALYSASLA